MARVVAGYGEKDITPPLGSPLTGYGNYRDRRGETLWDPLKGRGITIECAGTRLLLVSCDLLGFTVEYSDGVRRTLAAKHRLPVENVLIACTHTHCGPPSLPMRGMGEPEPAYLATVSAAIEEVVEMAIADEKEADFSFQCDTVEPIGFNRCTRRFEPIDPTLKVGIFKRPERTIFLLNYACHPVTLGPAKVISADWPGGLVQQIEQEGHCAIFFQGFCGDINPVTSKERWGQGTKEDLLFYGTLLSQRAFKAARFASSPAEVTLKAFETRVSLPLAVPQMEQIERERQTWWERTQAEGARRFIEEWAAQAKERHAQCAEHPYLDSVPIHGVSIGEAKIIGLPGEVFCEFGLALNGQARLPVSGARGGQAPGLFTFGCCDGNVGYLPTASAYAVEDDYACYHAPKIYDLFPFSPEVEKVVLASAREVLHRL